MTLADAVIEKVPDGHPTVEKKGSALRTLSALIDVRCLGVSTYNAGVTGWTELAGLGRVRPGSAGGSDVDQSDDCRDGRCANWVGDDRPALSPVHRSRSKLNRGACLKDDLS